MEFLNPAALYAFLLLPLLLVPYLIRRRPRRRVFSSLLLLKDFGSLSTARAWQRLRLPPIFFLQLLLLLLLLLASGEPSLSLRPVQVALVLDNSASMQAAEGSKSRFQLGQDEAKKVLDGLPANARVDLYLIVPALARVTEAPLTAAQTAGRIASLKPLDLGEPVVDYGAEFYRLVRERGYERLYFLTDHPAHGQSENVRVIPLGRPKANLAVTDFKVARPSFASSQLEARVEIRNFSDREEKFKLGLKAGGKILAGRPLAVAAGKNVQASFENLPSHPYYEAEIDVRDGLALDNHSFAVLPRSGGLKILAVSPRPEALSSLRAIPGVELEIVAPDAYEKSRFEPHALEIFHYAAPAVLPEANALLILPPKENPLARVGPASSRPLVSGWREPHPLTRYVNFALFRPAYARPLKLGRFGEAILQSPDGPLAVALEKKNFRYLALGFDPFPFLGRQNLPMSIFTVNLLDWLGESQAGNAGTTGEPLHGRLRAGDVLVAPGGEKITLQAGPASFSRTHFQGVYQAGDGAAKKFFAVNFNDARESDLRDPAAIQLRAAPGASARRSSVASIWPFLLIVSLALLLLEWFVHPAPAGRRRVTNPPASRPFPLDVEA
jgi:hypothetical protein